MAEEPIGRRQFLGGVAASSLVGLGGCLDSGYFPYDEEAYAIQVEEGGLIESIELLAENNLVGIPYLAAANVSFDGLDQDVVLKLSFEYRWGETVIESHYIEERVSVAGIEDAKDGHDWSLPLTFEVQSLEGDLLARAVAVEYDSHVTPGGSDGK